MSRILWLVYERVPHPDAVSYPAVEEDVRLVLELLSRSYPERLQQAEQMRNYLSEQREVSVIDRKTVPIRRVSGLYQPASWRLVKWLSMVLPAGEGVVMNTKKRMRMWLEVCGETEVINLAS